MRKGNKKLLVLIILGLIIHQQRVNADVAKAVQLAEFAWSTFDVMNTAHDTYSKFDSPSIDDVLDKTDEIIKSLDDQGARIEQKLDRSMDVLLTRLPLMAEIADNVRLLNTYIVRTDALYSDLQALLKSPSQFSNDTIRYLIKSFTSRDGDDVQGTISQMFNLIVPQRLGKMKKSLFILLAELTRGYGINVCDTGASPQQHIVELFNIAMESEMQGFAMYSFGTLIEGYLDKDNYTLDIKRAEVKCERRAKEYIETFENTMSGATGLFRRCDPPGGHKRDVTFYEFRRFIQSFIVQEGVLPVNHVCNEYCDRYTQPTALHYGCDGYGCEAYGFYKTCAGRITNCVTMSRRMNVCEYHPSEPRRYGWFTENNGNLYGDSSNGCPGEIKDLMRVGRCDLCRCICVEDNPFSPSHRFISLREQITNVKNNMVATGLAFVMINEIAHVRVMQGKLGPNADILKNSTSWVEPEDIQCDMEDIFESRGAQFVKKSEGGEGEDLILDKDIAALTLEKRRINLDALSVPQDHVVTGVRFRRVSENAEGNIQLEIHATPFDGKTGELKIDSSIWLTPDDMPYAQKYLKRERREYKSAGTKNPIKSTKTIIDTKPYMFIDISLSSLKDDAGQTTIPLLDGLPVISDPPTVLAGVGLYHKAQPGYGGFLTFVLEAINQASYLSIDKK